MAGKLPEDPVAGLRQMMRAGELWATLRGGGSSQGRWSPASRECSCLGSFELEMKVRSLGVRL